MTKREEYGLEFIKITSSGNIGYNCVRKNGIVDENNLLQFISNLEQVNLVQEMISEIETHLNGSEVGLNTQLLEHIDLEFEANQLVIDEQPHTFPLTDIKLLLEEWLEFLES